MHYAVSKFKQYVYNRKIIIFTDHISLSFIKNCKLTSSKIARYIHEIMAYNPEIRHIPGKLNTFSDVLSRLKPQGRIPANMASNQRELPILKLDVNISKKLAKEMKFLPEYQRRDWKLKQLIEKALPINTADSQKYGIFEETLYKYQRGPKPAWKAYVPAMLEELVIEAFHSALIHSGVEKTMIAISEHLYMFRLGK